MHRGARPAGLSGRGRACSICRRRKLYGRHQFDNAGTAIAALRARRRSALAAAAFERGIAKADWPARMQRLTQGALVALAPPGSELWLDGGHNADGGRAIAAALADLEERVPRPLVLIVGMLATKDCDGFLRNFTGLARRVIAVPIRRRTRRVPRGGGRRRRARRRHAGRRSRDSLETALDAVAQARLEPPPRILITGSLYLAGEVLRAERHAAASETKTAGATAGRSSKRLPSVRPRR